MKNEFIPYEEALALKELGFDEPCVGIYHDNSGGEIKFTFGMFQHPKHNSVANTVSGTFIGENGCYTPLYQQAFRWFREKYELIVENTWTMVSKGFEYAIIDKNNNPDSWDDVDRVVGFKTYEEAELACLRKLIEIVKEKKL